MIKGLGLFSFFGYLVLSSQMGGFSLGFSIYFLSVLCVLAGSAAVLCLTASGDVLTGGLRKLKEPLPTESPALILEFEDLAASIRRDGLLSLESKRKEIKDPLLRLLLKRIMDGFEKNQVLPVLRNQALRRAEMIRSLELYSERFLNALPLIGLVPALWMMMQYLAENTKMAGPGSLPTLFIPFLMTLILQLILSPLSSQFFDEQKERVKLYYVLMEEGLSGIQDGANSEILRERLVARLDAAPKWNL